MRGKDGVSAGVLFSFLKRGEPRVVANRCSPLHLLSPTVLPRASEDTDQRSQAFSFQIFSLGSSWESGTLAWLLETPCSLLDSVDHFQRAGGVLA